LPPNTRGSSRNEEARQAQGAVIMRRAFAAQLPPSGNPHYTNLEVTR
jgi:hypothetical protein